MIILLLTALIVILVSATCSLTEACALSLSQTQIAGFSARHPNAAALWMGFKKHIERPIAVILTFNTIANAGGATLVGAIFAHHFGEEWLLAFTLIFTCLILLMGEILPKTLGVRYNSAIAIVVARPLSWAIRIMSPLLWVVGEITSKVIPAAGIRITATEELQALAHLAHITEIIGSHQANIIRTASVLHGRTAKDALVPADEVTFLSSTMNLRVALETAHMDPHTRFPLCDNGNRDKILGYVNFKELVATLHTNPADPTLTGIARPVHFVPPETSVTALLRSFIDEHQHLAIVRTAEGRTLGLITLEDIIEEIVGDIEDEFDRLPRMCHELGGGQLMVGGGITVTELGQKIGRSLDPSPITVSDWLVRKLAHLPKPGEIFSAEGWRFQVRRLRRGRVFEVVVSPEDPKIPAAGKTGAE